MDAVKDDYKPREAMFEHNTEKAQAINRHVITKQGLKMYTDKELDKMQEPVFSLRPPMPKAEFKKLDERQKVLYLKALAGEWDGLTIAEFSRAYEISRPKAVDIFRKAGIQVHRGAPRCGFTLGPKDEPIKTPVPKPVWISNVTLTADAGEISEWITRLGITGQIKITIEVI